MRDPLPAIRAAWVTALREHGVIDRDENVWQIVQRELRLGGMVVGVVHPALVWQSQGTTPERSADGRERIVEQFVIEVRGEDSRAIAESMRQALTPETGVESWEYLPDEYALDLVLATTSLEDFVPRRVAGVEFRC